MKTYRATRNKSVKVLESLVKGTQVHTILSAIMKSPKTTKQLTALVPTRSNNPMAVVSWYVNHLKNVGAVEPVPLQVKGQRKSA